MELFTCELVTVDSYDVAVAVLIGVVEGDVVKVEDLSVLVEVGMSEVGV